MLKIELEDVYFLTGLSKRGAPIILFGQWENPFPVEVYVVDHCVLGL
jgi:hypothetical protein